MRRRLPTCHLLIALTLLFNLPVSAVASEAPRWWSKWFNPEERTEEVQRADVRLKNELAGIQREFLRLSSAQDRMGSSYGLVVRMTPKGLELVGPDGVGQAIDWRPAKDVPGLEALLKDAGLRVSAPAAQSSTSPLARPSGPRDPKVSSAGTATGGLLTVQFDILPDRVGRCDESPEFRVFVEQIRALKDVLGPFEVTAANQAGLGCAEKVAKRITAVGLRATAIVGQLFRGGIVARARVGGGGGELTETPAPVPPGEPSGTVMLEDGRFKLSTSARIWIQRRLFGANVLPHTMDGFAFRSFPFDAKPGEFSVYAFDGEGRGAKLDVTGFYPLRFGQARLSAFQLNAIETVVSRWDQIEYIKLSDANVEELRAELLKRFEAEFLAYRVGVGIGSRYVAMDASGLKSPASGFHLASVTVRNRLLKRWILGVDVLAPVAIGAPALTRATGDLTYLIYGENTVRDQSSKQPVRAGIQFGATYYRASEPDVSLIDRGNNRYLSDFFGASVGGVVEVYPLDRFGLRLSGGFTPIPPTQLNSFSVSWNTSLEGDYCWTSVSCAVVQLARESYQIELKDAGLFSSELTMGGLFYRYAWK